MHVVPHNVILAPVYVVRGGRLNSNTRRTNLRTREDGRSDAEVRSVRSGRSSSRADPCFSFLQPTLFLFPVSTTCEYKRTFLLCLTYPRIQDDP